MYTTVQTVSSCYRLQIQRDYNYFFQVHATMLQPRWILCLCLKILQSTTKTNSKFTLNELKCAPVDCKIKIRFRPIAISSFLGHLVARGDTISKSHRHFKERYPKPFFFYGLNLPKCWADHSHVKLLPYFELARNENVTLCSEGSD